MRNSCPQRGQQTLEESFAGWHTCIGDPAFFSFRSRYRNNGDPRGSAVGLVLRLPGDHDDLRDVARLPGRTCKKCLPGELRRACPAGEPEEIKRMCGGGVVSALFPRMMISQLAEDDGSHGCALG